jgi:hypothetical protein
MHAFLENEVPCLADIQMILDWSVRKVLTHIAIWLLHDYGTIDQSR